MQRRGRKYKSRWTKKVGLKQLLATQENPRSLIQELEMRVRMLALQRETAENDTLHAIAGEQQRKFFTVWMSRSNPFNEIEDTETESDHLITRQKLTQFSCDKDVSWDELITNAPRIKNYTQFMEESASALSQLEYSALQTTEEVDTANGEVSNS